MSDKPPSRERYEQENPTVSFRISQESKQKLDELVAELDTTKKDWLEAIIDEENQTIESVRKEAHRQGRQDALVEHQLDVPCAVCGEPMKLSPDHHNRIYEILEQLSEGGGFTARPPSGHPIIWKRGHKECVTD